MKEPCTKCGDMGEVWLDITPAYSKLVLCECQTSKDDEDSE